LTGVPTADNAALAKVFDNYKAYADTLIGQNYSGATVMKKIIDSGKIVKQLEGPHLEVRTVLNTVKGYTINQAHIRGVSEGKAQVFGVDEWRIRELAETFYATPEEQNESYVSMLVYTLATAGVLTGGDQKVYAIANNPQLANA
jgi:hypothetical protein